MWRETIFTDVRTHSDPENQQWNDSWEKENRGESLDVQAWSHRESAEAVANGVDEASIDWKLPSLLSVASHSGRRRNDSFITRMKGVLSESTLSHPWHHYPTIHSCPRRLVSNHLKFSFHFQMLADSALMSFNEEEENVWHYTGLISCQAKWPTALDWEMDKGKAFRNGSNPLSLEEKQKEDVLRRGIWAGKLKNRRGPTWEKQTQRISGGTYENGIGKQGWKRGERGKEYSAFRLGSWQFESNFNWITQNPGREVNKEGNGL